MSVINTMAPNMAQHHMAVPHNQLGGSSDIKPPIGSAPLGGLPPNPLGGPQHHNLHMDQDMQSLMHQVGMVC